LIATEPITRRAEATGCENLPFLGHGTRFSVSGDDQRIAREGESCPSGFQQIAAKNRR